MNATFFKTLLAVCAMALAINAHTIALDTSLVVTGTLVQTVKTAIANPEGPVCDTANNLYFADFANFDTTKGAIWKVTSTGTAAIYKTPLKVPCGLKVDRQNHLIFSGAKGLWQIDLATAAMTTLALGDSLLEANDLSLTSQGGLFFTANKWDSVGFVYYRAPSGTLAKKLTYLVSDKSFPNGIVYLQEKNILYVGLSQKVANGKTGLVRKYVVDNQFNVTTPTSFANVSGCDGMAVDSRYNIWIANGEGGIAVFDSNGTSLGKITMDAGVASNCCFGGADMQTFYITSGTGVYSVHLKVKGRPTTGELPVSVLPGHSYAVMHKAGLTSTTITTVHSLPQSAVSSARTVDLRGGQKSAAPTASGIRIRSDK